MRLQLVFGDIFLIYLNIIHIYIYFSKASVILAQKSGILILLRLKHEPAGQSLQQPMNAAVIQPNMAKAGTPKAFC